MGAVGPIGIRECAAMKAKQIPFLELFNQRVQYLVPRWQRRYRWGKPQIERLLNDLLAIATTGAGDRSHYGGTMITVLERRGVVRKYRVVDGQQRMTTVSLLLACIAQRLGSEGQCGELTGKGIRDDYLTNPKKREFRKLRLQDGDEDEYGRIIEGDSGDALGGGRVASAWRIINQLVDSENMSRFVDGLHRLRAITIVLEGRDDPQQIFESLNATGEPLTEGEKVKNWLLMGLPEDVQNDLHDDQWLPLERDLGARREPRRIDVFFRDLMRWRTGRLVSDREAYDEFRRWAITTSQAGPEHRPALCKELAQLAALYGQLTGSAGKTTCSPGVQHQLRHLRAMGFHVHRPFTLRILREATEGHEKGEAAEWLDSTLGTVSMWITRRWLAGRDASLAKTFGELAHTRLDGEVEDVADYWTNRIANIQDERLAVPTDGQVMDGIRTESKYGGRDTPATKAFLSAIMEYEDPKESPRRDALTVEHIMPRKLTDEWIERLGDRADAVHEQRLDCLGNLTLTAYNSEAGNRDFPEKVRKVYKESSVKMTRRLAAFDTWDESTILHRAHRLGELAVRLWPWTKGRSDATR